MLHCYFLTIFMLKKIGLKKKKFASCKSRNISPFCPLLSLHQRVDSFKPEFKSTISCVYDANFCEKLLTESEFGVFEIDLLSESTKTRKKPPEPPIVYISFFINFHSLLILKRFQIFAIIGPKIQSQR